MTGDTNTAAAYSDATSAKDTKNTETADAIRPIVTIGLLDNDRFALAFLERSLAELMPEARILWSTTSGRAAVRMCTTPDTMPNVLLTDMSLDELSGPAVIRAIRIRTARVAILAVTSFSLAVYAPRPPNPARRASSPNPSRRPSSTPCACSPPEAHGTGRTTTCPSGPRQTRMRSSPADMRPASSCSPTGRPRR
ncbi:two component transcriptional regulator, LuxR family [Bifidobacterium callitrichos DSM 23973]|uniref:Two component transcriptional regulator, LuxR family n=1 Tax=Bifidobacterium callitrichos DSM 23973 TaxID=1437609 RepID=A0A086ZUP1_9BIFI|nr:response regulator [Bifidobacterium callitrichos]KFI50241.1 two component transcriptional regulator, LuxR family [Bifidobacterium callitrichos DSM 23973]